MLEEETSCQVGGSPAAEDKPLTADAPQGRLWTWQEGDCTVIRSNARTGPGCHDNCGVLLYVKDGKLKKIEGDPENPYNQGRLCLRCLAAKEMIEHPSRLLYPLKRSRDKRGQDCFERTSWEEAFSIITREFTRIIDAYGAQAINVTQGTGRDINGYGPLLARLIGTPNYGMGFLSGQGCYAPRLMMMFFKVGDAFVCDYSQFSPERYDDPRWQPPGVIMVWGNNPVVANSDGTLGHWVVECMKRGSEIICIDPKLTWLAGRAKHWLQVRPGTDAALALAFCNVIINEQLYDADFVSRWTYGFEQFAESVQGYTPDRVATICDVGEQSIIEAARAIARAKGACLQWGVAVDHTSEGFYTGMTMFDLLALTGNFEKPGTMVAARPCFGVEETWLASQKAIDALEVPANPGLEKRLSGPYPALAALGMPSNDEMLKALETGKADLTVDEAGQPVSGSYPVKAVWLQTNNTLACMGAQPQRLLPALQGTDLNVVVDLFMTPTAMAVADIVLPAACFSERPGLTGHHPYYLGAIAQATNPPGECKSDQRIIFEFARHFWTAREGEAVARLASPWETEEEFYDWILRDAPFTYAELKERTWAYPEFCYNKHEKGLLRPDGKPGFNTQTGRYEFHCLALEGFGLAPLSGYSEPPESPVSSPELAEKYPLVLTTGARRWGYFHSEHRQSPTLRQFAPWPEVMIHPQTAKEHGIGEGDWVLLENDFGSCRMRAHLSVRIRRDTVSADHGWWFPERDPGDGTLFGVLEVNVNQLLPMRPGRSGYCNSYKSQLCRISKAADTASAGPSDSED
ncbi:MAG: molybdopterin-dependent oxidoreductase [Coriobacteriaceae bacterium]|jgi:anaerobic selenocysteine-containing dehydrogenase|nr:molybdopterin-dependent oxidoreductase [Coriobacteriaceae bacterium]